MLAETPANPSFTKNQLPGHPSQPNARKLKSLTSLPFPPHAIHINLLPPLFLSFIQSRA